MRGNKMKKYIKIFMTIAILAIAIMRTNGLIMADNIKTGEYEGVTYEYNYDTQEIIFGGDEELDNSFFFKYYFSEPVKKITVSEGVTRIGDYVFSNVGASTIKLPSTLKFIGKSAFAGNNITNISIPEGVEEINGYYLFKDCSKLKEISIPAKTLVTDASAMFENCTSLTKALLTETKGFSSTFLNCTKLNELYIAKADTKLMKNTFKGCESLSDIIVPVSAGMEGEFKGVKNKLRIITSFSSYNILEKSDLIGYETSVMGDLNWYLDSKRNHLNFEGYGALENVEKNGAAWAKYKTKINTINVKYGITKLGENTINGFGSVTRILIDNPNTEIDDNAIQNMDLTKFKIVAPSGSKAQTFAEKMGIKFEIKSRKTVLGDVNIGLDSGKIYNLDNCYTFTETYLKHYSFDDEEWSDVNDKLEKLYGGMQRTVVAMKMNSNSVISDNTKFYVNSEENTEKIEIIKKSPEVVYLIMDVIEDEKYTPMGACIVNPSSPLVNNNNICTNYAIFDFDSEGDKPVVDALGNEVKGLKWNGKAMRLTLENYHGSSIYFSCAQKKYKRDKIEINIKGNNSIKIIKGIRTGIYSLNNDLYLTGNGTLDMDMEVDCSDESPSSSEAYHGIKVCGNLFIDGPTIKIRKCHRAAIYMDSKEYDRSKNQVIQMYSGEIYVDAQPVKFKDSVRFDTCVFDFRSSSDSSLNEDGLYPYTLYLYGGKIVYNTSNPDNLEVNIKTPTINPKNTYQYEGFDATINSNKVIDMNSIDLSNGPLELSKDQLKRFDKYKVYFTLIESIDGDNYYDVDKDEKADIIEKIKGDKTYLEKADTACLAPVYATSNMVFLLSKKKTFNLSSATEKNVANTLDIGSKLFSKVASSNDKTKLKSIKKVKLSIKKVKKAKGYQVAIYSSKSDAKKNRRAILKKIVKKTKISLTLKNVKNSKKVYVRFRSYTVKKNKKKFGKWSKIKCV